VLHLFQAYRSHPVDWLLCLGALEPVLILVEEEEEEVVVVVEMTQDRGPLHSWEDSFPGACRNLRRLERIWTPSRPESQ
jgi:hypothetical protein